MMRLLMLVTGSTAAFGVVYAAGKLLVPLTTPADRAILAAVNPSAYLPGFDELFRAINDYTDPFILLPLLCWMIAFGVYRRLPGRKQAIAVVFSIVAFVLIGITFAISRNKTYVGVNVLLVIMGLAAFGTVIWMFIRMDDDMMRRFARVFWLVALAGLLTDAGITQPIKHMIKRPRPLSAENKPWNEHLRPVPDELLRGNNSYPSGHASGAFALLTPLFWFARDRRVRAGLMGWAVLQGIGRVYTVAHFPFCVLMGGLLGFWMGTLVFFVLDGPSLRRDRVTDGPA